jgi:hypothetical protein
MSHAEWDVNLALAQSILVRLQYQHYGHNTNDDLEHLRPWAKQVDPNSNSAPDPYPNPDPNPITN